MKAKERRRRSDRYVLGEVEERAKEVGEKRYRKIMAVSISQLVKDKNLSFRNQNESQVESIQSNLYISPHGKATRNQSQKVKKARKK